MSGYILIAVISYMLFAINGIVDKFLLTRAVKRPEVYVFYIGITSFLTWFLAPFGLKYVSPQDLVIAIVGGAAFVIALYFLYLATQQTSISRLLPIEGGFVPMFTLIFAYVLLGERLAPEQITAFVFLVGGAILMSFAHDKKGWHARALGNAVIAAALFALHFTLTKYIFDRTNFVSGLIWTRIGFSIVSLSLLIPRSAREAILHAPREAGPRNITLYYLGRLSGGLAGFLQNYAIAIGSVTLVNALQGTQYVFLLGMTFILSRYFPRVLKEHTNPAVITQKILAIALVSYGLYLLT